MIEIVNGTFLKIDVHHSFSILLEDIFKESMLLRPFLFEIEE